MEFGYVRDFSRKKMAHKDKWIWGTPSGSRLWHHKFFLLICWKYWFQISQKIEEAVSWGRNAWFTLYTTEN